MLEGWKTGKTSTQGPFISRRSVAFCHGVLDSYPVTVKAGNDVFPGIPTIPVFHASILPQTGSTPVHRPRPEAGEVVMEEGRRRERIGVIRRDEVIAREPVDSLAGNRHSTAQLALGEVHALAVLDPDGAAEEAAV